MVNEEKNRKTKLPPLGIIINFGVGCAGLALILGLLKALGATFSTVLGVYLGYRLMWLVMRLFWLLLSVIFTLFLIFLLTLIITLLIF
jgi:hypothetical protein